MCGTTSRRRIIHNRHYETFHRFDRERLRRNAGSATLPGMTSRIDARLGELGVELPVPSQPGANYVPFARTGDLVFLTGQLSQWNGERRFVGKLGREFGVEEGRKAARLCALNLIAHLREAVSGDLDRVVRCVRIAGFV